MSDDQVGWEIAGRFYPHIGYDGLWQGDYALIREVTGLPLDQFDRGDDILATETGWLAVAVWHGNQEMRRDQVVQFVEKLRPVGEEGGPQRVGWEAAVEPAPLDGQDESPDSGRPSSSSGSTPADDSSPSASPSTTKSPEEPTREPSTLDSSGGQPSATGAISPPLTSVPSSEAAA